MQRPVDVLLPSGEVVPCELVDLSEGGGRLRGNAALPLGPIRLALDDQLELEGLVVNQLIDLDSGNVSTGVAFDGTAVLQHAAPVPPANRRPRRAVAAGVVAAVVALVAVGLFSGRDNEDVTSSSTRLRPAGSSEEAASSEPDGDTPVAGSTAGDGPAASPSENEPITDRSGATDTEPEGSAAPPAAAPTPPALVTTNEAADNTLTVTIAEDPAENSAESSVGPSSGVDRVRVELHVNLEKTPSGYTTGLAIENRSDDALTFDGGLRAVIEARRDGAVVETVSLHRADVTELAPGASVTVEGVLALAEPGTYDVFGSVEDVTTSASDDNGPDA